MPGELTSFEFKFADLQVAPVNLAGSSSNNVIVTGVAGKRIVVMYGWLSAGAASTSYLFEGSGGTALTGVVTLSANSAHEFIPPNGAFVLKAPAGESLRIDVGAGDLDGWLVYGLVQAQ